jgi:hypothetical protein
MCAGWGSPNGAALINALAPTSPDFTLLANPSSVSVTQGSQGTTTITDHSAGRLHRQRDSLCLRPAQWRDGAFSPNPTTGSSTLTLTATATARARNRPRSRSKARRVGVTNSTLLVLYRESTGAELLPFRFAELNYHCKGRSQRYRAPSPSLPPTDSQATYRSTLRVCRRA